MWILKFVGSKLGLLVASVLGVLGSIVLVFGAGKRDQKKDQDLKDLEEYVETREKLDEVVVNDDVDAALERLSKSRGLRD
jgi:hypothetical protein|tara:strand:- start:8730 stop:8969 length:240 start_codon:yes stop_codon:yes gene_type:complete